MRPQLPMLGRYRNREYEPVLHQLHTKLAWLILREEEELLSSYQKYLHLHQPKGCRAPVDVAATKNLVESGLS